MKKLTKSQRVYMTMLAVALVAFTVDTVFLGGEARVQQAGAETLAIPFTPPAAPPVEPAPAPDRTASLAEALKACDTEDISQVPEAFEPSASWRETLCPPPPEPTLPGGLSVNTAEPDTPEAALAVRQAQRFAETHNLMSIIRTSNGGTALVDGQLVQVGRKLDGFTLLRLTERGAVFEAGGKQVELRLSADQP